MFDELRKNLKVIFETTEYDTRINEEDEPTNDFIHVEPDGTTFNIKVEPDENEFNVFDKSGKQIDIFLPSMADQDGGLSKGIRKSIMDDYNQNHSQPEEVAENKGSCELKVVNGCAQPDKEGRVDVSPIEENKEVINKFKKEYGDKAGEAAYYATANKQGRNPETFHKMKEDCDKDPEDTSGCIVQEEKKAMEEALKKGVESHGGAKHGKGPVTKDEAKGAIKAHRQQGKKDIKDQLIDEENKINKFPLEEKKK